jgi:hypothetical protein
VVRHKRIIRQVGLISLLCANVLGVAVLLLFPNLWTALFLLSAIIFDIYALSVGSARKKKMQYPLVPPEGKPDWYLPLTNIPRPVTEDFRKIEEKKRKFAKIRKIVYKATKPKKK